MPTLKEAAQAYKKKTASLYSLCEKSANGAASYMVLSEHERAAAAFILAITEANEATSKSLTDGILKDARKWAEILASPVNCLCMAMQELTTDEIRELMDRHDANNPAKQMSDLSDSLSGLKQAISKNL